MELNFDSFPNWAGLEIEMIPSANVQPHIQTHKHGCPPLLFFFFCTNTDTHHTHTHTHHLPHSMARAKLPRLNYKCFSGLELQDIMKQCGTLRGNYPAALLPFCSPCEVREKMNSQSTKALTLQKFHLPSPPSISLPPHPGFTKGGGGGCLEEVII